MQQYLSFAIYPTIKVTMKRKYRVNISAEGQSSDIRLVFKTKFKLILSVLHTAQLFLFAKITYTPQPRSPTVLVSGIGA